MAQKRMFDKAIIDTDKFMDLPMSTKALYFLLGMESDDEGFVSYKKVLRIHGGNEDDVKVLISKKFLICFQSGVVVITDWNSNNWLDSRRIKETEYQIEKKMLSLTENKKYVLSNGLASIEEYRTEENSIEEYSIYNSGKPPISKQELLKQFELPEKVNSVMKWQDEAANACSLLNCSEEKKSSIFKCFKDNNQKAKISLSDCKELGRLNELYFLKVYNSIK